MNELTSSYKYNMDLHMCSGCGGQYVEEVDPLRQCSLCSRWFNSNCIPEVALDWWKNDCLCYWCWLGKNKHKETQRLKYNVNDSTRFDSRWIKQLNSYLPFLPQATVALSKYTYDAKHKVKGKGPGTIDVSFIMLQPNMERDVNTAPFIRSMQCKWPLVHR